MEGKQGEGNDRADPPRPPSFPPPLLFRSSVAVGPEEEARHIRIVNRLHKEVYPDFDRELYLDSDLLPPPKKKKIVPGLPPPPPPRTPKRLPSNSTSNSNLTTPTKSKPSASRSGRRGSISYSQPPSSPQSSATFSFSDISLASEPSSSQLGWAQDGWVSTSLSALLY